MKKVVVFLIIVSIIITLAGCTSRRTTNKEPTQDTLTRSSIDDGSGSNTSSVAIVNTSVLKDVTQGIPAEPNDNDGPGPDTNVPDFTK